ncbi:MAG: hypothetical protein ACJ76Z_03860 [Thermoleophilaceae bacterium]
MMLAVIRPSSWNPLLFVHVAGAIVLVALSILAVFAVRKALRAGDQPTTQFAFRLLLRGVLPAWIVMRVGAQLIADKEYPGSGHDPSWIGVGYSVSEGGLLLLLIALVLTGLAARTAKHGEPVQGAARLKAASVLTYVLVLAYIGAIFAMTAKPA